jgi:hypothetical protein
MATIVTLNPSTPADVTVSYPTVHGGASEISSTNAAIQAAADAEAALAEVESIRDDMTATTSLAYREFTDDGSAPSAPVAGRSRIYIDDAQTYVSAPTGTLGAPFIIPTWYSGNITLSPSDPWERIFKRHAGDGVITLQDGTYTASAVLTGFYSNSLDIRAQNVGGAEIVANWALENKKIDLLYMDLTPKDDSTAWLVQQGGYLGLRDTQTDMSGHTTQKATLGQIVDGHFHVTAFSRDCTFHVGDRLTAQIFDVDSGASLKFVGYGTEVGYTPGHYIDLSFSGTDCAAAIIMDVSHGLFTGTHFTGPGKAVSSGNGLLLRRGSSICMGNGVAFTDFYHACRIIAGGYGHMFQGDFTDCTYAFRKDSGLWEYVEPDTTFTGVTTVARSDISDNIYAGGAPGVSLLQFTTAGATIAAGSTVYIGPGGSNATESQVRWRAPCDGVLRNLYPSSTGNAGAGKNFVYTVRVNTADTTITCTTADSTVGTDTTHSVAVSAGDYIDIKLVTDAGANARPHVLGLAFYT